jgi:hypothetical protein
VVAGPGDEMDASAAGRGRMRASDADREQVIEVLKDAFAQGRLTRRELDSRAGRTFASRTYAELVALTADIPPGRPSPRRVSLPVRGTGRQGATPGGTWLSGWSLA